MRAMGPARARALYVVFLVSRANYAKLILQAGGQLFNARHRRNRRRRRCRRRSHCRHHPQKGSELNRSGLGDAWLRWLSWLL